MNPMQNKTPEERKAIAVKSVEARRRNREERMARSEVARKRSFDLSQDIDRLEARLEDLQRHEVMGSVSAALTGKTLLRADEIAASALPWSTASGVYFLLQGSEVVYVGQSVSVYARIAQHEHKRFDRYAFVPCAKEMLDQMESLYIHLLRPRLNGVFANGIVIAPLSISSLLSQKDAK